MTVTKAPKKVARQPQAAPVVLAGRVRDSRAPAESGVTRSGRCPDCGYLIGSPGHENTCGRLTSDEGEGRGGCLDHWSHVSGCL